MGKRSRGPGSVLIGVLSLFFIIFMFYPAEAENLVKNPSFEAGADGSGIPDNWRRWGAVESAGRNVSRTAEKSFHGKYSIVIEDDDNNSSLGLQSDPIEVKPGEMYRISGYVLVLEGTANLIVQFFDASNKRVLGLTEGLRASGDDWVFTQMFGTAPDEAQTARVLCYSSRRNTGKAYFDSIAMEEYDEEGGTGNLINHGVAAPAARGAGVAAAYDGDGNHVILVWHNGMLMIDAKTGKTTHVALPDGVSGGPLAVLFSRTSKFYALFGSTFLEFDPAVGNWTFHERVPRLTAISLTESDDGIIYAGLYPDSHLISFNPKTGKLVNHGQLNVEIWGQYPRPIAVDSAGWVYCGIGNTRSHLVGYNPATGEIKQIAKEEERELGRGHVFRGTDGNVYGKPSPDGRWYRLYRGERIPVESPPVGAAAEKSGGRDSVFRDFSDGSVIKDINFMDKWAEIEFADVGERKRTTFDYEAEGGEILSLIKGPDGGIYGGSRGLRFFKYDDEQGIFQHWGLGDRRGHHNAMAVLGNSIYTGIYARGDLMVYDVARPWKPGEEKSANPKIVARGFPSINRPHALVAHLDGKYVIMGGTPGYGRTGGGLMIYNAETNESVVLTDEEIVLNQSTNALVALPDGNLVGGTTITPGTGGERIAEEAQIYIFDWANRKVDYSFVPIEGVSQIRDMIIAPDGLIYGIADGPVFFVFDAAQRKIVHSESMGQYGSLTGGQAPRMLALSEGGDILAIFRNAIVRIEPGSLKHEAIDHFHIQITSGIVVKGGRLFFSSGPNLWSYKF